LVINPDFDYMKKLFLTFSAILSISFLGVYTCLAQVKLVKNDQYALQIPNIESMVNSPTHFYVLSKSDGLIVFRAHPDSLQWLYTSPGMQKRGDKMTADIRFAYLFGNGTRLTIIEPTSLLGVYSSTYLPKPALDAGRINNTLYLAMGSLGIGMVSLKTPEAVDSSLRFLKPQNSSGIIDLENTPDRLLALSQNHVIYEYSAANDSVKLQRKVSVDKNINHIFLLNNELLGSTPNGHVFRIDNSGNTSQYFSIKGSISQIAKWKNYFIIRSKSGKVWVAQQNQKPVMFRNDEKAGNFFTISKGHLWMNQYSQVNMIAEANGATNQNQSITTTSSSSIPSKLILKPIPTQTVPYPHPLLLALLTQNNYPAKHISFHYRSSVKDAKVRGNGFYWQPSANQTGLHRFTIIATSDNGQVDSTSFMVHVTTFNQPPRFSPVHSMSLAVNQAFTLNFHAVDPDGTNRNLVRYLGVNLPKGASINEHTGQFSWTPNSQQVGKNTFRVIATDQYGAAASMTVNLTVVNVKQ